MKITICAFIFAQLCLALVKSDCPSLQSPPETACSYANAIKLTTSDKTIFDNHNCDSTCEKSKWKEQPMVQYSSANPYKTYTIVLIDPDDPVNEKGEYYLHWVMSNVSGKDLATGDVTKGKALLNYEAPNPTQGKSHHRFMILVFEEEEMNQKIEQTPNKRDRFGLIPWLQKQPKHLCGPVAGIQFKLPLN